MKAQILLCVIMAVITAVAVLINYFMEKTEQQKQGKESVAAQQIPVSKLSLVIFNGMRTRREQSAPLENYLKQAFPESNVYVAYTPASDSIDMSVSAQANAAYEMIKQQLPQGHTAIFIGLSQGGVRMLDVVRRFGDKLNVAGCITVGSPNGGLPAANQKELLAALTKAVQPHMATIPQDLQRIFRFIGLLDVEAPGISELKEDSEFIKALRKYLKGSHKPLMLNIAAHEAGAVQERLHEKVADLANAAIVPHKGKMLTICEALSAIHGSADHDVMIPVSSQLAHSLRIEHYIVHKCTHLPFGDPLSDVFTHPDTFEKIRQFVQNKLQASASEEPQGASAAKPSHNHTHSSSNKPMDIQTTTHKALEVTDATFDQIIQSKKPVLIDFWATWCRPCRVFSPIVDELAADVADQFVVGKVDVNKNPAASAKYGIKSVPTIIIFKEGQEVDRLLGSQTKAALHQALTAQAS